VSGARSSSCLQQIGTGDPQRTRRHVATGGDQGSPDADARCYVKAREAIALTSSEEITLRRVAHGQSDVSRLSAGDLARLRTLYLIDDGHVPRLTVEGRRRFDRLAKSVPFAAFDAESELTALVERLARRRH
jgi:hypothetical protein